MHTEKNLAVSKGKQFALRDHLHKVDAIIVLAGTRGNINFLNGKIRTAVHLYQQGWAPRLIFTGKFSAKVAETPTLFPIEELQRAVSQGRIQEKDVVVAAKTWDTCLGATYMCNKAVQMGVPPEAIFICKSVPTAGYQHHQLLRRHRRMAPSDLVPLRRTSQTGKK